MKSVRPYTPVRDILDDFIDSDNMYMEVDLTPWRSNIQAYDSIRHCIKEKHLNEIYVFRHRGKVYLAKKERMETHNETESKAGSWFYFAP